MRRKSFIIWHAFDFQEWPQLDVNYSLKLHLTRNGKPITNVPVAVWRSVLLFSHIFTDSSNFKLSQSDFNWFTLYIFRFADLNEEDALGLACGVEEVQNGVLREDFITRFEKVAGKKNTTFTWWNCVDRQFIGAPEEGGCGAPHVPPNFFSKNAIKHVLQPPSTPSK